MSSSPSSVSKKRSPGPSSPSLAASRRSPGAGYSHTKTKRSTVSAAFNTSGPSATAATQTNSAVIYGNSSSPMERSRARSVSGKASSPGSTSSQKATSVVTVGTVTDPDATASQLLATKTPQIMAGGSTSIIKSPSVTMTSKMPSAVSVQNASGAAAPSIQVPATSSLASAGGGSTKAGASISKGSAKSPPVAGSTSRAAEPASIVPASSMVDGQASSMQPIGHGIIDVTNRSSVKIEMGLAIAGCLIFGGLWIYMYLTACWMDDYGIFFARTFSGAGVVACLFVLFHSFFERRFSIGRGVDGCCVFFLLSAVIFLNLYDAFSAMNCICKCSQNAFSDRQNADLIIFILSIAGSMTLIAILLVSSVAHADHTKPPQAIV